MFWYSNQQCQLGGREPLQRRAVIPCCRSARPLPKAQLWRLSDSWWENIWATGGFLPLFLRRDSFFASGESSWIKASVKNPHLRHMFLSADKRSLINHKNNALMLSSITNNNHIFLDGTGILHRRPILHFIYFSSYFVLPLWWIQVKKI